MLDFAAAHTPERGLLRWSFEAADLEAAELWVAALGGGSPPQIAAVAAAAAGESFLHDVFLDTGDRRLQAAGRVLRISLLGDAAEATLEAAPATEDLAAAGGVLRERLPDTAFAAPTTAPGPVGERLRSLCGGRSLAVLYERHTYSRRYVIRAGAREVGQLSLDRVDLLREDARPLARRCSIEVTADSDAVPQLSAFVAELCEAGGLRTAGAPIEADLLDGQNEVLARPQAVEADESIRWRIRRGTRPAAAARAWRVGARRKAR